MTNDKHTTHTLTQYAYTQIDSHNYIYYALHAKCHCHLSWMFWSLCSIFDDFHFHRSTLRTIRSLYGNPLAYRIHTHTHTRHMPFIMWMYEFHNITKIKKEKTQTTWGTNTRPHYSRTSRMYAQNETHIHCRSLLDHIFMNKNVNNFSILLARKINVDKMNWMLRHKEMILNGTWIIN